MSLSRGGIRRIHPRAGVFTWGFIDQGSSSLTNFGFFLLGGRLLGLSPAPLPHVAQATATEVSGGKTSLNSGVSSALGVFGDLGAGGLSVYFACLFLLWSMLQKQRSARATAAACALALFTLLGAVFDWWEQPPFTLAVAVIVGLALADPAVASRSTLWARTRAEAQAP